MYFVIIDVWLRVDDEIDFHPTPAAVNVRCDSLTRTAHTQVVRTDDDDIGYDEPPTAAEHGQQHITSALAAAADANRSTAHREYGLHAHIAGSAIYRHPHRARCCTGQRRAPKPPHKNAHARRSSGLVTEETRGRWSPTLLMLREWINL